jgi:hypothetical protein
LVGWLVVGWLLVACWLLVGCLLVACWLLVGCLLVTVQRPKVGPTRECNVDQRDLDNLLKKLAHVHAFHIKIVLTCVYKRIRNDIDMCVFFTSCHNYEPQLSCTMNVNITVKTRPSFKTCISVLLLEHLTI